MRTISSEQLIKAIAYDPSWAKSLKTPVKVTGFVNLRSSKITHLSEFLIFDGKNTFGEVANFEDCKNLQVPLGTFNGGVNFEGSGIKWVPEESNLFTIKGQSNKGMAANFSSCQNLESAGGHFIGGVDFTESTIKTIGNLKVNGHFKDALGLNGFSASFYNCQLLEYASGTYEYPVDFTASSIKEIIDLEIQKANASSLGCIFVACQNLKVFHGRYPGLVNLDNAGITTIKNTEILGSLGGIKLSLKGCKNLKSLPKEFDLSNIACDKELEEKIKLKRALINSIEIEKKKELETIAI